MPITVIFNHFCFYILLSSKSSDDATVVRDDQSCLSDPLVLQDTMEKIVLLRKAVEKERRQWTQAPLNDTLNVKLQQYASLLASQGALQTAYGYLAQNTDVCLYACIT